MLVCRLAVSVRILAMVESRGRVLLPLLMVAVIVVMGRLPVVVRRRLMVRSGTVMVFAGRVLLFLGHGNFLLDTTSVPDVFRATCPSNFRHELHSWRQRRQTADAANHTVPKRPGRKGPHLPGCFRTAS
jgi:hypothetical protein